MTTKSFDQATVWIAGDSARAFRRPFTKRRDAQRRSHGLGKRIVVKDFARITPDVQRLIDVVVAAGGEPAKLAAKGRFAAAVRAYIAALET